MTLGLAALAAVGHIITKQCPDFDARNYGYAKLGNLIAATTLFELNCSSPGDGKRPVPELAVTRYTYRVGQCRVRRGVPMKPGSLGEGRGVGL
ncbi:OST-HTH/LOTUS domain-containing protein [Amycolatopsis sp. BJA-103]|uniref:OST-HTH/LOTUS domain-containing protein n=1 Tax=Amycolatopsis sp. BJA-103 TaxID=1911175 RepID=UPI000CBA2B0C|nr:OST-HTH/LOTUS domain-containing protein [Amycolatopsis sp. BJA-103]PNE18843.1 hypothetical protein B1H26_13580 [Amycolatopsis sp. BJA-103]